MACGTDADQQQTAAAQDTLRVANAQLPAAQPQAAHTGSAAQPDPIPRTARTDNGPRSDLPPNELGRIPVVEYHLFGAQETRWTRTPENFRKDLELLYERGYRPVSLR
ncbi:MAG: hypothetical protein ACRELT_07615, partial [Longimicrobiales bacterium]